jgi:hypothetical protein
VEFKACFEHDRGAIQSELWTPFFLNLTAMKPLPTPRQMKILYISKTDIEWESTNLHGKGIAEREV